MVRPSSVARSLWASAKRRASSKEIPFEISPEDIQVPHYCPVLGIPLKKGVGKVHDASPTLDRITPDTGYVVGNIVVVSMRANRLKSDASIEELRRIASFYEQLNVDKEV